MSFFPTNNLTFLLLHPPLPPLLLLLPQAATLSALALGSAHVVLCGDPHQLPATVNSRTVKDLGYDRSLFERLEASGTAVCMLATQYRMRSDISRFPRAAFYGNRLRDGKNVDGRPMGRSLMQCMQDKVPMLAGPLTFLDLPSQEEKIGVGIVNPKEAELCVQLVEVLQKTFGYENLRGKIGVITPYAKQVGVIKRKFDDAKGKKLVEVEVNSVDGYQGREKDIIIFSAVRAGRGNGVGFLADRRRMNVALTRPREMLVVVAHADRVRKDPVWRALHDECRRKGNAVNLGGRAEGGGQRGGKGVPSLQAAGLMSVRRPGPDLDFMVAEAARVTEANEERSDPPQRSDPPLEGGSGFADLLGNFSDRFADARRPAGGDERESSQTSL